MRFSEAVRMLTEHGVQNARHDARVIFMKFGGLGDRDLLGQDPSAESEALTDAILRRSAREPLQYIIGEVDFYRESYYVSPDCLIPRSDTEILVDTAVRLIPDGEKFIDLCTGSGCIAISTLKNTKNTTAVAVDISPAALKMAKKNAERNAVSDRLTLICKDALTETVDERYFAVLSNPPYVTEEAYAELEEEISKEPKLALVGAENGLIFYKRIISGYKDKLCDGGFFALEIGYDQGDALREIAAENGFSAEIIKDYGGNDRVALLKNNAQ